MGTVKGVLIGTVKGIGFLAYGTLKIGFLAIKLLTVLFLFVLQLFLILIHVGTPERRIMNRIRDEP